MEDAVQVAVRVRPFNSRERRLGSKNVVQMKGNRTALLHPSTINKSVEEQDRKKKNFAFDYSFWSFGEREDDEDGPVDTQETVFEALGGAMLDNAFKGYNCTLLAYGQTGSGKTFSMMGEPTEEYEGIIPRLGKAIFSRAHAKCAADSRQSFQVQVSYLEIYAERIHDLLRSVPDAGPSGGSSRKGSKPPSGAGLKIRQHPKTGPYVEDLTQCAVSSYDELETQMILGNRERTVAATNMNARSSRSHAVFTILLTQTTKDPVAKLSSDIVAKIHLVDLAGSERQKTTGVKGQQLKEAAMINKSLSTLGLVIQRLAKASGSTGKSIGSKKKRSKKSRRSRDDVHIPFRNSVLTWLLKDSLGGNSKTIMIATLSPASVNYEETLTTLRYANQAKQIRNKPIVNEDPNAKLIRALRAEIDELRKQLEERPAEPPTSAPAAAQEAAPAAAAVPEVDPAEVIRLREQLEQSQKMLENVNRTWEEKLEEAKRRTADRLEEMQASGMSLGADHTLPFLVNLHEDPSMSEQIVYHLPAGAVYVGSVADVQPGPQKIILKGANILPQHAVITHDTDEAKVWLDVGDEGFTDTYVNGTRLVRKTQLRHGDRIIFGNTHFFRFSVPRGEDEEATADAQPSPSETDGEPKPAGQRRRLSFVGKAPEGLIYDFEFAQREKSMVQNTERMTKLLGGEGDAASDGGTAAAPDPVFDELQQKMQNLEEEKIKSVTELEAQQAKYEELMELYEKAMKKEEEERKLLEKKAHHRIEALRVKAHEELQGDDAQIQAQELSRRHKVRLREELLRAFPLVDEANSIVEALGMPINFAVDVYPHMLPTRLLTGGAAQRDASLMAAVARKRVAAAQQYNETRISVFNSPLVRAYQESCFSQAEIIVQVTRVHVDAQEHSIKSRRPPSLWSVEQLVDAIYVLREMYQGMTMLGAIDLSMGDSSNAAAAAQLLNPHTPEKQLVGTAHVYLHPLVDGVAVQQRVPIVNHSGDRCGMVTLQICCTNEKLAEMDSTEVVPQFSAADLNMPLPPPRSPTLSSDSSIHSTMTTTTAASERSEFSDGESDDEEYNRDEFGVLGMPDPADQSAPGSALTTSTGNRVVSGRVYLSEEPQHLIVPEPGMLDLPLVVRVLSVSGLENVDLKAVQVAIELPDFDISVETPEVEIDASDAGSASAKTSVVGAEINFVHETQIAAVTQATVDALASEAVTAEVYGIYCSSVESDSAAMTGAAAPTTSALDMFSIRESRGESLHTDMGAAAPAPGEHRGSKNNLALRRKSRRESFLARKAQVIDQETLNAMIASEVATASSDTAVVTSLPGSESEGSGSRRSSFAPRGSFSMASQQSFNPKLKRESGSGETVFKRPVFRSTATPRADFAKVLDREHQQRQKAMGNLMLLSVDVETGDEESASTNLFFPSDMKMVPREFPRCLFRVPASFDPKRFVITLMQADPRDCVLESCVSVGVEYVALTKRLTSVADMPDVVANAEHVNIPLVIHRQTFEAENKLLRIEATWPPELCTMSILQKETKANERIVMGLTTSFYLARCTKPVELKPIMALKTTKKSAAATLKGFFSKKMRPTFDKQGRTEISGAEQSPDRLFNTGTYLEVTDHGNEDEARDWIGYFASRHRKLRHMLHQQRLEQHASFMQILSAEDSEAVERAQGTYEVVQSVVPPVEDGALGGGGDVPHHESSLKIEVRPVPDDQVIVKQGFLAKRGQRNTAFKRRWCVLRPPFLFYYKKATDPQPAGLVNLLSAAVSLGDSAAQAEFPFCFDIHCHDRIWHFQANSDDDMEKWVEAIVEFNQDRN